MSPTPPRGPSDDDFFSGSAEFDFGDQPRRGRGDAAERQRAGRSDEPAGRSPRRGPGGHAPKGWRPGGRGPRRPAWQRGALVVVGAVVLVLLASFAVRAAHDGRAMPGTTVAGADVGGKPEAEIRTLLGRITDPERRLALEGPDGEVRVSLLGAGLQPDISRTVKNAMDAGRGSVFTPLLTLVRGTDVPLAASIDEGQLTRQIKRIASELGDPPFPGAIVVDPGTRAVSTKAPKDGREVRQGELRKRLKVQLRNPGREHPLTIPMKTTESVSQGAVDDVAEAAEAYLRAPLRLTGAGEPFIVTQRRLAGLLTLESYDDGRKVRLGVGSGPLEKLIERVGETRDRSPRSARVSAPASGPTVDGKAEISWQPKRAPNVKVLDEGREGRMVRQEELGKSIRAAVREDRHSLQVPVTTNRPPVSRAGAEKINSVIGTFTTYYVAGQPRVTNIQRMARSVDQTIIAPGEQFSLNGITGERTKAKGYVEAPFIADNKIEPSVGGGVSQFSTTMYNAAYFAGLKIDAFHPHSLYIDRYPAGREATLNFPDIDMKWTNDTSAPVLVRASYDSGGVTVTLYGDNGGRKVSAIPGARQPNPGGNFAITVTRKITYADGRVVEQPTTTRYATEVVDDEPQE